MSTRNILHVCDKKDNPIASMFVGGNIWDIMLELDDFLEKICKEDTPDAGYIINRLVELSQAKTAYSKFKLLDKVPLAFFPAWDNLILVTIDMAGKKIWIGSYQMHFNPLDDEKDDDKEFAEPAGRYNCYEEYNLI